MNNLFLKDLRAIICGIFLLNLFCMMAEEPALRHVFDIRAEIGEPVDAGDVGHGKRVIIPITGGEVKGVVNGTILPGGADYQLVDGERKKTELKAIYSVKTDDSCVINVTNEGINTYGDGNYYFTTSPKFECDVNSRYAWLNDRIFVCRPVAFEQGAIVLRVWEVR